MSRRRRRRSNPSGSDAAGQVAAIERLSQVAIDLIA
jgi:hypothetical protein